MAAQQQVGQQRATRLREEDVAARQQRQSSSSSSSSYAMVRPSSSPPKSRSQHAQAQAQTQASQQAAQRRGRFYVGAGGNGQREEDEEEDEEEEELEVDDAEMARQGLQEMYLNGEISEEEDDDEDDDDDDDDLSTSSGKRHGLLLQPDIEDWPLLESPYMTHWNHKRHLTGGNPKPRNERDLPDWRMRERLRTVSAALVLCLNIGVDPPDVSKTTPCSKLICWMDPTSIEVAKALPAIGKNLQAQFETLSMKTRYKQYLDPIVEDTKRFSTALRRGAKDERVLFYYNGYGVPKPTPGGEIWVFNKAYTQYIPVTLYDLQAWLGSPCIFVWDASAAGNIVVNFKRLNERKNGTAADESSANNATSSAPSSSANASAAKANGKAPEEPHFALRESIHLAACAPDEVLPMNPDLPADLFTCCLTSPIEISLRWFVLQNPLPSSLNVEMVMNIPGRLQDRRTPLGELNWIFTAITDTIAWTVLPRTIFRRLFRDDLMVAALLRNFLLAERIMRFYHCTPMSHPKLPHTHTHPLWDSWDLAVDQCLSQLPTLLAKEHAQQMLQQNGGPRLEPHLAAFEYRHSTFFSEQLKAFEVWLAQGGVSRRRKKHQSVDHHDGQHEDEEDDEPVRDPPDQLPIVLQVLLSQVHRLRALILLSRFLDLGPWAVNLALSIGIFPYVLKLLQSPAADLKPVLIYIWARILAVDRSCQNDLLRDNGFVYFAGVLSPFQQQQPATSQQQTTSQQQQSQGMGGAGVDAGTNSPFTAPNVSEHRAMCAFIISVFSQDFLAGQQACLQTDAMDSCLEHLDDDDFLLRQWSALCLAQLWDDSSEGKAKAVAKDAHGKLCVMLSDVAPEVRSAVLYALAILLGASGSSYDANDAKSSLPTNPITSRHVQTRPHCLGTGSMTGLEESKQRSLEIGIAVTMLATKGDCSPMVRKELVIALSPVVREYQGFFVLAAYLYYDRERPRTDRDEEDEDEREYGTATSPEDEAAGQEVLLKRVLSKLALQEGIDEVDIANIPAFTTLFVSLLDLAADSHPEVASMACSVVDYITALLLETGVYETSDAAADVTSRLYDATNRVVTPTSTLPFAEGYFPYTPRSRLSVNNLANGADEKTSGATSPKINGAPRSPGSLASHGSQLPYQQAPHHREHAPRRTPSLAQTVKAIATLGYSRPSSPTGPSTPDGTGDRSTDSPPLMMPQAARVPAPRFNSARYISPYAASASSPLAPSSTAPVSPAGETTTNEAANDGRAISQRSMSAESLAQIARLQDKRRAAVSNSKSNGQSTPGRREAAEGTSTANAKTKQGDEAKTTRQQDTIRVADALCAVVAADLARFRLRPAVSAEGASALKDMSAASATSAGNTPFPSPSASKAASPQSQTQPQQANTQQQGGQGQGQKQTSALRETLPLKSRLFAWCSEYYTEPQMKQAEDDEPGSVKYNVQTWRRERNERLVCDAAEQVSRLSSSSSSAATRTVGGGRKGPDEWTEHVATMQVGAPPSAMLMHQFESWIVTASEQDTVAVWDWEQHRLLSRFQNGNPPGTNITSLSFVNEDVEAMLLVGSADGDVRIYSRFEAASGPELVSSLRALPDLVRSKRPSGLIVDWQQVTGRLLAGGDSKVLRVWDAHRELCLCDIPTRASSCVTSLSSEVDVGHIFVAGFGDGTVGVYDMRNPPESTLVRLWEEHQTWVNKVQLQKRGNRELVSCSVDGEVRLWDIRARSSIRATNVAQSLLRGARVGSMAVHEAAPLFAISSRPRPGAGPIAKGTSTPGLGPMMVQMARLNAFEDDDGADSFGTRLGSRGIVRHFNPTTIQSQAHQGLYHPSIYAASPLHGPQSSQAAHQQQYHHHNQHPHPSAQTAQTTSSILEASLGAPLDAINPSPSPFSPASGCLAFHPHWPILAFSAPDRAGTTTLVRPAGSGASADLLGPMSLGGMSTSTSGAVLGGGRSNAGGGDDMQPARHANGEEDENDDVTPTTSDIVSEWMGKVPIPDWDHARKVGGGNVGFGAGEANSASEGVNGRASRPKSLFGF